MDQGIPAMRRVRAMSRPDAGQKRVGRGNRLRLLVAAFGDPGHAFPAIALAREVAGVSHATLIPHVYPVQQPGMPLYSLGLRPPRTVVGRLAWRATGPLLGMGLRKGRDEMNETRARLGLGPIERFHGGISELLAVVATFPQLEYPREWPAHVRVTGPLFFEVPGEEVAIPEGRGPLVVIAPSTSQDPECELL